MANSKRVIQSVAALLISGYLIASAAWAQTLQVIDLQYRSADEVIPVLQPLLESGSALTGEGDKLFVRASANNLAQLKAALAQIDRAPRQMLVSVRRASREEIERERIAVSGTVRGTDGAVSVGERARSNSGVTVRANERVATREGTSVASVQVLEGNAAQIATGTSVPIVTPIVVGRDARGRPWAAAGVEHRQFSSGVIVVPRVNGDRVVLDVEQQDERPENGAVRAQRLSTQVSGRLGEWIALGSVSESSSSRGHGILERQYSTNSDERTLWIRVDPQ